MRLLKEKPKVINIGTKLFYESLRAQNVEVVHVEWRPPAGGDLEALKLLEKLKGSS
ncbi:MAG TPA: fdrA domain protein [Candidatus Korarchaeota archaeon]|nr:fdrA domain protein [Candidatus Korarchaeota archaeon]